jgi:hypothetical protein
MSSSHYYSPAELVSVFISSESTETNHDLELLLSQTLQNSKNSYFAICDTINVLVYDLKTLAIAHTVPKDKNTHAVDFLSEYELVISTPQQLINWDLNHNVATTMLEFDLEEFKTSWVIPAKSFVLFCSTLNISEKRLNLWNVRTNKVVKSKTFYSAINEALELDNTIITCNNFGQFNIWSMSLEKIHDIPITDRFIYSVDIFDTDNVLLGIDTGVICYNLKLQTGTSIKAVDRVRMARKGHKRNTIVYLYREYYTGQSDYNDGDLVYLQVFDTITENEVYTSFWGTHNGSFVQNGSYLLHCRNGELTVVDIETMQETSKIHGRFDSAIKLCAWDAKRESKSAESQIEFSDSAKTVSSYCTLS